MEFEKDFEEGYFDSRLGKIHYKEHMGDGDKIVLIHGLAVNVRTWRKFVPFLPEEMHVVLVDLLGHGLSAAPDIDYSVFVQVNLLNELLADKKLLDSFIMGHSYGGWIAAMHAIHGYKSKGIILEDAAGMKEYFDDMSAANIRDERKERLINDAMALSGNSSVIRSILEDDFENGSEHLTEEMLSKIDLPTMIVWGKNDPTVSLKYGELFNERIRNSKLEVVPGAEHTPHYTHPKEVSSILLKFIGANSP